jgi:hypothetical protein
VRTMTGGALWFHAADFFTGGEVIKDVPGENRVRDSLRRWAKVGDSEVQYQLGFLVLTECDLISGREARRDIVVALRESIRAEQTVAPNDGLAEEP